jgi:hypothetical protein
LPFRALLALAGFLLALLPAPPAAAQAPATNFGLLGSTPKKVADGVLGLMGFLVVPDSAASTIQINRSSREGDTGFFMTQLGTGFTVSESAPLYLEGYLAYSRYDPRFVFTEGQQRNILPTRWNSFAATIGIGWDVPLTENLVLRPMVNGNLGHVESDLSLATRLIQYLYDVNLSFLRRGQLSSYGYGGSLVLDYSHYREAYEVDVELRYTQLQIEGIPGSSSVAVRGTAQPITLGLWSRLRLPTSWEMFSRPLRTVFEVSHAQFLGDQATALGFNWITKIGAGLEADVGRYEFGALGLYLQRVRIMGRAVVGPNVSGFSVGLGFSF